MSFKTFVQQIIREKLSLRLNFPDNPAGVLLDLSIWLYIQAWDL